MGTFEDERTSGLEEPDSFNEWNTAQGLWWRFLVAAIATFGGTILWIRMDLYGISMAHLWGISAFFGVSLIAWFGFITQAIADIRVSEALNSLSEDMLSGEFKPW